MVIIQEKVRGPRCRMEALTMGVSSPFKALQTSDYNNNTVGTNLLLWTHSRSPPFSCFLSRFANLPSQWQAWRVSFSGYVGSCLKGWMPNLWQCCFTPAACAIVQSIIRQRSQQDFSLFTHSWPIHTQTFLCGPYHTRRAVQKRQDSGVWIQQRQRSRGSLCLQRLAREEDWGGTASAEMSQMSQIYSHRRWEREGRLVRGVCSEAVQERIWR